MTIEMSGRKAEQTSKEPKNYFEASRQNAEAKTFYNGLAADFEEYMKIPVMSVRGPDGKRTDKMMGDFKPQHDITGDLGITLDSVGFHQLLLKGVRPQEMQQLTQGTQTGTPEYVKRHGELTQGGDVKTEMDAFANSLKDMTPQQLADNIRDLAVLRIHWDRQADIMPIYLDVPGFPKPPTDMTNDPRHLANMFEAGKAYQKYNLAVDELRERVEALK